MAIPQSDEILREFAIISYVHVISQNSFMDQKISLEDIFSLLIRKCKYNFRNTFTLLLGKTYKTSLEMKSQFLYSRDRQSFLCSTCVRADDGTTNFRPSTLL